MDHMKITRESWDAEVSEGVISFVYQTTVRNLTKSLQSGKLASAPQGPLLSLANAMVSEVYDIVTAHQPTDFSPDSVGYALIDQNVTSRDSAISEHAISVIESIMTVLSPLCESSQPCLREKALKFLKRWIGQAFERANDKCSQTQCNMQYTPLRGSILFSNYLDPEITCCYDDPTVGQQIIQDRWWRFVQSDDSDDPDIIRVLTPAAVEDIVRVLDVMSEAWACELATAPGNPFGTPLRFWAKSGDKTPMISEQPEGAE